MTAMLNTFKQDKPWAKLRLTRKQYEAKRPWKTARMDRKWWEELTLLFPDEAIDSLYREADAEKLVEASSESLNSPRIRAWHCSTCALKRIKI